MNTQPAASPDGRAGRASPGLGRRQRRRAAPARRAPPAGVALPRPAAGRASVLRGAGAGAPPGAALGLLHAESDGLVELTPGTRPPGGKVEIDRRTGRALPARRRHRTRRMARAPAGARPPDRRRRLPAAVRRPAARGGVRRGDAPYPAARQQGRRRVHPVAVGRRRPPRAAARPVGVPGGAALPRADRERRVGRHARLLQARPSPRGGAGQRANGRDDRGDRARQRQADPLPGSRPGRQAGGRGPGVSQALTADAPRRDRELEDGPVRADRPGRLPA